MNKSWLVEKTKKKKNAHNTFENLKTNMHGHMKFAQLTSTEKN